jgi:ribosomal protein S18 acetylase RimI-like enzyme
MDSPAGGSLLGRLTCQGFCMVQFRVRPASLTDLDILVRLFDHYRQFYQFPSNVAATRSFLLARFYHNESVLLLAENEQAEVVGFAQLFSGFSSLLLGRTLILSDLFILPQFRRQGAATSLLDAAVEHAEFSGVLRLTLSTAVSNALAQSLYEKGGWLPDEQFCVYHLDLKPTADASHV